MSPPSRLQADAPYYGRPPVPGTDPPRYYPAKELIAAANTALALEMPLLLTGEPGCGKSQFAWALARALQTGGASTPLCCYVRSDSRARDLLYHYDAVRRFGDTQAGSSESRTRAEDARRYVTLEPLGQALCHQASRVVLIDEIDKAPRDLPNDLLNELEQGDFLIPEIPEDLPKGELVLSHGIPIRREMRRPEGAKPPFILITSNAERQLPEPFLRRCAYFHIPFPSRAQLRSIVTGHQGQVGADLLEAVLDLFLHLRTGPPKLKKKPGTAELLHFVKALHSAYPAEQQAVVKAAAAAQRDHHPVDWRTLPGLECLVKLVDDLRDLRVVPG